MPEVRGDRWGDRWPVWGGFLVAWVATGLLSRLLVVDHSVSLLWPPAGVAVLWFLVRRAGWRSLDSLLLGAAAFTVNVATGAPVLLGVVFAVTNLSQTLVVAALLRRWCPDLWGCGGERGFDSGRVAFRAFVALAVGMAVGAGLGALGGLVAGQPVDPAWVGQWYTRQLSGALLVAPLGLLVGHHLSRPRPRPAVLRGPAGAGEYAAALAFTVVLHGVGLGVVSFPLGFVLPVGIVWVGVRFPPVVTAVHATLTGAGTLAVTLAGFGRFADIESPYVEATVAQTYVTTLLFIGLALSTRREENLALARGLRETERRARFHAGLLDSMISSMTEGVAVVDHADRVVVSNPAADRLGYVAPRPSDDGHPGFEVFHPDGTPFPPEERPSQRALGGEVVADVEVRLDRDGRGPVLSVSAVPLPGSEGEDARALLIFRDSTEAFTQRSELATFAGTVAHDLRNPLSAVEGWAEVLEDALAGGEVDPSLVTSVSQQLRLATGRMHSLIGDLLDHATSGHRRLQSETLDVGELVDAVAGARGCAALVRCQDVPAVSGDPVLVSQVLDNLVGNALKYVAPGTVPEVVVAGRPASPGWVLLSVTDNGVGLPPGEQERIFQEFHRAHGADYEGTGLGLAIVRRIVLRHGGDVQARPRSDGRAGSVFELTLPAAG